MAVKLLHINKSFGAQRVLKDVSLEIETGQIVGLLGPNGAGKSTLMKILIGLWEADGERANGERAKGERAVIEVPERIGYLPENNPLYEEMYVVEYLRFMAGIYAKQKSDVEEFVKRGSEISELGDRLNDKISNYSRGMQRRLLLARAIMSKPALAILDEPTSGLDIINALEIRRMIKQLAADGMSFLLSSHNMLEIEYVSDRVGIIAKGHLLETGAAPELVAKYGVKNLEEVFEKVVTVR